MFTRKVFFHETSQIVKLGTPVVIGQLAQMSMAFVDTVVAGQSGAVDMAGVAVGGSFWTPMMCFSAGLFGCITPLVAQEMGSGQHDTVARLWRQGLWLALMVAVMQMLGLFGIASGIPHYDAIGSDLAAVTSSYVGYILWGLPGFLLFLVCRSFIEGKGHTRPAMFAGLVGLICNIPLNCIFVFGYGGMPRLGGAGCGLASAIVCWIMAAIMLYNVHKLSPQTMAFVRPNFNVIKRLVRIGAPNGTALLLEASAFVLIALFVAPLGEIVVAGHQAAYATSALTFTFPLSLGIATSIRVGSYLGQKDYEGAKNVRKTCLLLAFMAGCFFFTCIYVFRESMAHVYSHDAEVISIATLVMLYMALYQIPDNIQIISLGVLRGYNDTRYIFVSSTIAYWCISLPLGYILCFTDYIVPKMGVVGFWCGLIVGLTTAGVMLLSRIAYLERRSHADIAARITR
ncbi:MAG: MATE family efflux transporter [Pseudomonadota bacterium]